MDRIALALVFEHIIDGFDIPAPSGMLRMKADAVATQLPGTPYSLLTNLAHTVLWQRIWLHKLKGGSRNDLLNEWKEDWRAPDAAEWAELREAFLGGLDEAKRIAASEPFDHQCKSDEEAVDALVRIAVHSAYHCGQMNLLKRMSK